MDKLLPKEEYINIQLKVYNLIESNIRSNKVSGVDYKVREQDIFYRPNRNIVKERKFTANINPWLNEIEYAESIIVEELLYLLAYQEIYNSYKTISKYVFTLRERYLKLVVYDMFSIREKLAYLIYELFDRKINLSCENKRNLSISFNNIYKKIDTINLKEINWITNEEFVLLKKILNSNFNTEKCKYIFNDIRHSFTHRSNPGIGCLPLLSYDYPYVDNNTQKMLESLDKRLGENIERKRYRIVSAKPKEKQFDTNEVIEDILAVWNLFIEGFEILLKEIQLLRKEIIEF